MDCDPEDVKEEYEDKFPNGIACKVIRPDIEFTNDDEWRNPA